MSTFYKTCTPNISFREYWWSARSPVVLIWWLIKLLRIPVPVSPDDPNVDSLQPFEIPETGLPEEVRTRFQPLLEQLRALGFHSPVFHAVAEPIHSTQFYFATLCHDSGQALGRIYHRIWSSQHPPKHYLFPEYLTGFTHGTLLCSSAGKPGMLWPQSCRINRMVGATSAELWASHQRELAEEVKGKELIPIRARGDLLAMVDQHHAVLRDFHLRRKIFVLPSEEELKRLVAVADMTRSSGERGLQHGEVLAELDQLQRKKTSWGSAILVLVVSMLLFFGAGATQWSWKFALMLIPVLLFHEAGHYLAMRAFDYRNLRMFFIPFFGAAVSGRHYNVPGWKRVIVSLMGPVPGIVLGVVLGVAGMVLTQPLLTKAAILTLILNGFNLLPVLPLDGGWVFHTILFSRHYLLDTAFRFLAAISLIVGGTFSKDRVLEYLGIFMLIGLPASYKTARITSDLRKRGIAPASPDDDTIPLETAQAIVGEVKRAFPRAVTNKTLAQYTLSIFETLNTQPPGWLASIGLLGVHVACGVMALVFAVLFVVGQRGDLGGLVSAAASLPRHKFDCGSVASWRGPGAAQASVDAQNTIIITFSKRAEADKTFQETTNRLPASAAAREFGETILVALPVEDDAARKEWVQRLQLQSTNLFVDSSNLLATFSLACIAPNEQVARAISDEVKEYADAGRMYLIPPWSGSDTRSSQQRQQHRLARQTYVRLQRAGASGYRDPAARTVQKKMVEAQRRGDKEELTKLQMGYKRSLEEANQRALQKVRQESQMDTELVERYLALSADGAGATNRFDRITTEIAPLLGQLPLRDGRPLPGEERYSSHWGSVGRNGLLLTFNWFSLNDVFDGAPALAGWLCKKGCLDFKYDFHPGGSVGDLEEE